MLKSFSFAGELNVGFTCERLHALLNRPDIVLA